MNRPPEIIVNSGFVTDQNGVLTEVVIPASVTAMQAPATLTFMGEALNWIPSTTAALQVANIYSNSFTLNSTFKGYNNLTTANCPNIVTLDANPSGTNSAGHFNACTSLTTANFSKLVSIGQAGTSSNNSGHFNGCTSLTTVNMPQLATIDNASNAGNYNGTFCRCSALVTITLPSLVSIGYGTGTTNGNFASCTSLESVQFGSEGHAVTSIGGNTFVGCTQPMTITIYTSGGASLSGEPWGATNADTDIIYEVA